MFFTRGVLQSTKCAVQRRSNFCKGAACLLCWEISHQAKSVSGMPHQEVGTRTAQVRDFNGALTWDCLAESQ